MTGDPVRIIPHSPVGIPDTGSFEVRTPKLDQRRGYLPRDADPRRKSTVSLFASSRSTPPRDGPEMSPSKSPLS